MRTQKHGFTLIELLVVIAIIAILAAILFPIFSGAKERARQAKCLDNLKQLSSAVRLYADDHDGGMPDARVSISMAPKDPTIPAHYSWEGCEQVGRPVWPERGQIWTYTKTKEIYICPTDKGIPALSISTAPPGVNINQYRKDYPLSYTMNCMVQQGVNYDGPPMKMDGCRRTGKVMLLWHESRNTINDGDGRWPSSDAATAIHYDGTTLAYFDLHASWISNKQIMQIKATSDWDPKKL